MWCTYRLSTEVYCLDNMAKQIPNKVFWPSSCFEKANKGHTFALIC